MTEEVMGQVDKKLIHILDTWANMPVGDRVLIKRRRYWLDLIYAIPEILIKDPDQSLPEIKELPPQLGDIAETLYLKQEVKLKAQAQQAMLKENWVKCYPKGANQ